LIQIGVKMKGICRFFYLALLVINIVLGEEEAKPDEELKPDTTVMIPMRDGVELPTDLYLPSPDSKGLPCILLRSPAGRQASYWKGFAEIAKAGYVVAIQDTRNVLDSEGKTFPFLTDGWGKLQDGYDTVEWLALSPYTNGKIGTWGSSALGITQLLMAPSNPPHLKCQYIVVAAASLYHHALYPGGQLLKNQAEGWLGFYARDTGVLSYVCQRPFYNDFWKQLNTLLVADRIHVPAIHIGGWYDTFLEGTLTSFVSRQNEGGKGARGQQKLIIGPWTHYWPGSKLFGDFEIPLAGQTPPVDISAKRWFDHYLKEEDNGVEAIPSVIYYVMGPFDGEPSSGNVWRTTQTWPPVEAVPTSFYLTPDQGLQQIKKPFEGLISYLYDPNNPIPTLGGRNLFLESGPKDQRSIEERKDIILFTSDPLDQDIEVTGNVAAKLFIASDQKDTDIVVRLCDVYPDGKSILIADGIYRLGVMCYADNQAGSKLTSEVPSKQIISLERIKPTEITVNLGPTSMVFAKGHSIRISISSSNYPRYEKNMNVGILGVNSGRFNIAKNTLFMGDGRPSQLILPIVQKEPESLKESKPSTNHESL
jgi:predicted acyl esterase